MGVKVIIRAAACLRRKARSTESSRNGRRAWRYHGVGDLRKHLFHRRSKLRSFVQRIRKRLRYSLSAKEIPNKGRRHIASCHPSPGSPAAIAAVADYAKLADVL